MARTKVFNLIKETQVMDTANNFIASKDNVSLYEYAAHLAETNQARFFYQLLKFIKRKVFENLKQFHEEQKKSVFLPANYKNNAQDLPKIMDTYITEIAPLFIAAFAGMKSWRKGYMEQASLIVDLTSIDGWASFGTGISQAEKIPEFFGFVFHHLHGALIIDNGGLQTFWSVLLETVPCGNGGQYEKIYKISDITSFPVSLGGDCEKAFRYLLTAYSRWSWLQVLFATEEEYKNSLVAYSMASNIFNYFLSNSKKFDGISFPSSFSIAENEVKKAAETLLMKRKKMFKKLIEEEGLTGDLSGWASWVPEMQRYCERDYSRRIYGDTFISALLS